MFFDDDKEPVTVPASDVVPEHDGSHLVFLKRMEVTVEEATPIP